jgi:NADH-quinone oxidoreductase subunit M
VLGFYPAPALDLVRAPASTTLEQVGVHDTAPAMNVPASAGTDEGSSK